MLHHLDLVLWFIQSFHAYAQSSYCPNAITAEAKSVMHNSRDAMLIACSPIEVYSV